MSSITILGAGSWGTAIAISLCANPDHEVALWPHRAEAADALIHDRENRRYLPGFALPESLKVVTEEREAVTRAEILLFVTPSEFLRATLARVLPYLDSGQILLSATKGIEDHSFLRMTEVIAKGIEHAGAMPPIGALSGPSFAQEVAAGMPTALTVAFPEPGVATAIQRAFSSPALRLYTSDDLIGVEMGGALKNVIAIAAGVLAGLGLGQNSAAGLITRGIAEMTRLAVACGARRETLAGLSGIGDLVLTCTGSLSRNRTVGFELGRGRMLAEILTGLDGKVAEGVRTTRAALGLARRLGVEMPITEQMELILDEGKDPRAAIRDLMLRPGRHEED